MQTPKNAEQNREYSQRKALALTVRNLLASRGIAARPLNRLSYTTPYSVFLGLEKASTVRVAQVLALDDDIAQEIAAAHGVRASVRMSKSPLGVEVLRPNPTPLRLNGLPVLEPHTALVGQSFGMDGPSDVVLPMEGNHLLVAGQTGSGKSTALAMVVLTLALSTPTESMEMLLSDAKNEDLRHLEGLPHVVGAAWGVDEAQHVALIRYAYNEMERRITAGPGKYRRVVLVIDELPQMAAVGEFSELLGKVMQMGRSKGITVIGAAQGANQKELGGKAVASNFTLALVGKMRKAAYSSGATGMEDSGAERLPGNGSFVLAKAGELQRLQGYMLDAKQRHRWLSECARRWMPLEAAEMPIEAAKGRSIGEYTPKPAKGRTEALPDAIKRLMDDYAEGVDDNGKPVWRRGFVTAAITILNGGAAASGGTFQALRKRLSEMEDTYLLTYLLTSTREKEEASGEVSVWM